MEDIKIFVDKYKYNKYSQNGEDGLIEELLYRLKKYINLTYWCCEFGALDGINMSNTFKLVEEDNYNCLFIESDTDKYNQLTNNMNSYPKVKCINEIVDYSNLEKILLDNNVPYNFDILSIDIDGNEYSIWESLNEYKPNIVIIEICPIYSLNNLNAIFDNQDYLQTGILPMIELGKKKGYFPVAHLMSNLIFVKNDLFQYLNLLNNNYFEQINNILIKIDKNNFLKYSTKLEKYSKDNIPSLFYNTENNIIYFQISMSKYTIDYNIDLTFNNLTITLNLPNSIYTIYLTLLVENCKISSSDNDNHYIYIIIESDKNPDQKKIFKNNQFVISNYLVKSISSENINYRGICYRFTN